MNDDDIPLAAARVESPAEDQALAGGGDVVASIAASPVGSEPDATPVAPVRLIDEPEEEDVDDDIPLAAA
eukprot:CAMPEP_0119267580 /NCGR_PEP_ID=MMETSP1329-20130426/5668_1 /TAXON_ID=114041 /ORGANISM="Genus nov. species nov., Strain RCC1024" /LENGTH=69 /DNA_ID=CAMNT_0007267509 /DNA_START=90 /DNA_END=295 /DNA_ORIENTATION=+